MLEKKILEKFGVIQKRFEEAVAFSNVCSHFGPVLTKTKKNRDRSKFKNQDKSFVRTTDKKIQEKFGNFQKVIWGRSSVLKYYLP